MIEWNRVTKLSQIVAIVLFVAVFFWGFALGKYTAYKKGFKEPQVNNGEVGGKLNGNPTDFAESGTISFPDKTNTGQQVPHLTYKDAAGANITSKLVFDPISFCSGQSGATPCVAMSVTYDIPFGGKNAVVEGIYQDEGEILVRKLYILQPGEEPRIIDPGQVFISWPQAINFIESCSTSMVMQTHTLDIYLTMKDGTRLRTVEPMIDDVFKVTQRANSKCGNIGIATE